MFSHSGSFSVVEGVVGVSEDLTTFVRDLTVHDVVHADEFIDTVADESQALSGKRRSNTRADSEASPIQMARHSSLRSM